MPFFSLRPKSFRKSVLLLSKASLRNQISRNWSREPIDLPFYSTWPGVTPTNALQASAPLFALRPRPRSANSRSDVSIMPTSGGAANLQVTNSSCRFITGPGA